MNSFIFFAKFSDINVALSGFGQQDRLISSTDKVFKLYVSLLYKNIYIHIHTFVSEHFNFEKKPYIPMNIHLPILQYIICTYMRTFFFFMFPIITSMIDESLQSQRGFGQISQF